MKKYYIHKLTDPEVRYAKPHDKKYKLVDGGGLYCEVLTTGTKAWRYNYRIHGKQKTYTIGTFPQVGLSDARIKRDKVKNQVSEGVDPSVQKQLKKRVTKERTFQAIAETWLKKQKPEWSTTHYTRVQSYLKKDAYPWLQNRDIAKIEATEIIPIIEKVAERGAIDAAKRVKGFIQQVFDYAVAHGKAKRNPAKDINLKMILPKTITKHYAAITDPIKLGELLRSIDDYHGTAIVRFSLKLLPMVMLRPTELTSGEWIEIDFKQAIWRIPAKRRKLQQHIKRANKLEDAHIVPLSEQAIEVLNELHQYTGRGKYLFPSLNTKTRPISNNTLRSCLRRMGYDNDTITAHGFRAVSSTFLNTLGYRSEVIEAQLSHKDANEIRAAYNHADYLQERREMLQEWANYMDTLKNGAEIIPIRSLK